MTKREDSFLKQFGFGRVLTEMVFIIKISRTDFIFEMQLSIEAGAIGRQANGAVLVRDGETVCHLIFRIYWRRLCHTLSISPSRNLVYSRGVTDGLPIMLKL